MGDKKIDILIPARRDFDTPLEQSMTTFKNLRDEGVCNQIGISELGADSIRKAASIVPIAMIEVEYSLLVLDIEKVYFLSSFFHRRS